MNHRMIFASIATVGVLALAGCSSSIGGDSTQDYFVAAGVYLQTSAGQQFTFNGNSPAASLQQVDSLPVGAVQACSGWSGAGSVWYDPSVPIASEAAAVACENIPS